MEQELTKAQLFARWQELWMQLFNCEVEYNEETATALKVLVSEQLERQRELRE